MLLAGLRSGFALVTILMVDVHSSCLISKTCPCGATGKNYTRCYTTEIENYSCERWANCQTCNKDSEICSSCPPGRYGATCRDGPCPLLKRPNYGSFKCSVLGSFISSCTSRCLPGYQFENEQMTEEITLKCFQNVWTPRQQFPECKLKKQRAICPDPGTPKDGGRVDHRGNPISSRHTFMEGEAVFYFCTDRNAVLQGSTYLTCKSNSTWEGILPQCIPSQKEEKAELKTSCKHPGVVENGIIEDFASKSEEFSIGTELRFLCREGYEIQGPNVIYCLIDFSWSEAPPVCKQISAITASTPTSKPSCEHPGSVENGFIVENVSETQSFPVGSVLSFQCIEGHEMVGAESIHCLPSVNQRSYWSGIPPYCRNVVETTTMKPSAKISCKHPGMVTNGFVENHSPETESFPVGTALKFRCREGYAMEGPKNLYCLLNSEWSDRLPNCRMTPAIRDVTCEHPGMVKNGEFEGDRSMSNFPVGTPLTIRCAMGTVGEGPMTIYCLRSGMWSEALPRCKSIQVPKRQMPEMTSTVLCRHPGIIENGEIEKSGSKVMVFTVGSEIKFKCRDGYTMEGEGILYCRNDGQWTSPPPTCRPHEKIPDCGRVFQEVYQRTGEYTRSDWPWTVGISTVGEDDIEKMFCVGALLNSRTVLTAAHCVTSAQNIKLHFGHRQRASPASIALLSEQVRNVSRRIMHPEYDDMTHANDIALMKFDLHVYYDSRTQPICLPTPELSMSGKNLHPGTKAIVTGYGLEFAPYHPSTAKFKMVELTVQSETKCENVCRNQGLVSCSPNTFCAVSAKNSQECLYGGSPLVVYHREKNRYTLEGLVTRSESARNQWNGRCKIAESLITFTNVTTFMPFILENLN